MPETTPTRGYVVPTATDPDDVPYYVKSVVQQVETKAIHHTAATPMQLHVVKGLGGTPDASGYVTFAHGAPFTPQLVTAHIMRSGATLVVPLSVDSITATNVIVRFTRWDSGGLAGPTTPLNASVALVCYGW